MQYTERFGRRLSKLMLGTVQFGLDYGIANRRGQPTYGEVLDIIACAHQGGVNCLDTAAAYGTSEEVIGKALRELGIRDEMTVVTKVCHLKEDRFSARRVREATVEKSVRTSCERLGLETLPVCLFHHEVPPDFFGALLKMRKKGLVAHVGASMVLPENGVRCLAETPAEALQVPFNLMDARFQRAGGFAAVHARGTALFTRSVYLQGLVVMPEEAIIPELRQVVPVRRRLAALAAEAGMELAELALRYVLGTQGVTSVLVGVDTVGQMRENIALFDKGPLPDDLQEAVRKAVPPLPESLLNPANWPNAR